MYSVSLFIYNIGIAIYTQAFRLFSLWNKKARLRREGLKTSYPKVSGQGRLIWIHCASLGEFEQGRPLIEAIKTRDAATQILLTFYSASGYELRKSYKGADYVCYLPNDTYKAASGLIEHFKPELAIFVKYEFWLNHLRVLKDKAIPTYLVSANFRPNQIFFKWYGGLFKAALADYKHLFVQTPYSADLLKHHGITSVSVAGDTRIDRVLAITKEAFVDECIEAFVKSSSKVLIGGSIWAADEAILLPYIYKVWLQQNAKVILAPHEVGESNINRLMSVLPEGKAIRYSQAKKANLEQYSILVIDNIGLLNKLYRYGTTVYIGGGFGAGIHNTIEAAAYGLPTVFGPKYTKFPEAVALIELNAAFSVSSTEELNDCLTKLEDNLFYERAKQANLNWLEENSGATERILLMVNG